jgi:hypothetical protein
MCGVLLPPGVNPIAVKYICQYVKNKASYSSVEKYADKTSVPAVLLLGKFAVTHFMCYVQCISAEGVIRRRIAASSFAEYECMRFLYVGC